MTLRVETEAHGALLRLTLDHPRGNILDHALISDLREALEDADGDPHLRAVVLDAASKDFCWGASVEEHRPEHCANMLYNLHGLLLRMVELPLPMLIAVQGRCLGGGLELALAGSRIFTHPAAVFGQPEVKLGVFAPAASAMLAERIGHVAAEDLLLSGRTVSAEEAHQLKLVDEVVGPNDSPAERAAAYAQQHFFDQSRSALRYATRAARFFRCETLQTRLHTLEHLYLHDLMQTADAREGIAAFLEKRPPQWSHTHAPMP